MNTPIVRAVTRNGRTHHVEEPAQLPPLTPDEIIMRAVGVATAIVVTGALVWSTVSVGAMLGKVAPEWAAYMIAGVFDLTWIVAMAIEYVLRFEPARQKIPKRIGWLSLFISMAAIFTHGALLEAKWIGLFGALVSALAKGLWWLTMYVTSRQLDKDTQAWLNAELGEVHARRAEQMAVAKVERERERYALNQPPEPPQLTVSRTVNPPQSTPVQAAVQAPDQLANQIEATPEPAPVQTAQAAVRPVETKDQVAELHQRLKVGEHITKARAAEILGIPESTAYRRLTAAQALLNTYR
ncbi:hypothetical protein [Streptomyces stelliscabiei]|uniref:Protein transporter Sec31 n=1 Tax=Streptomyces stelliscabiei TaxID=146820 RepID=A0A8I0P0A9_9ACTN|nr:hypothetical protein [Streptomyces stelliscabiei]MBE1597191.1 hypothetical protein [Streptomyces stelliscabiei]